MPAQAAARQQPRTGILGGIILVLGAPLLAEFALDFSPPEYFADLRVIAALSMTPMPAFANPDCASQLFLDHTTLAVAHHIVHRYGGLRTIPRIVTGGLSARNERRA